VVESYLENNRGLLLENMELTMEEIQKAIGEVFLDQVSKHT